MLHHLQLMGLNLRYADPAASAADDWRAASALISHAAPELRLAAVQLLSALAHAAAPPRQTTSGEPHRGAAVACGDHDVASVTASAAVASSVSSVLPAAQQALVDAAFLSLCSAVSTDTVPAIRLEALLALAGMHHASRAVKQQALSKRATLRMPGTAAAAKQPGAMDSRAAAAVADGSLLDSATGAFVHGAEDDVVQVRIAAVSAVLSLGSQDAQLADEIAELLVELAADELLPVRLAALKGLVAWADQHRQRRQAAKLSQQQQVHVQEQQQQQQEQEQQREGQVQAMQIDQAPTTQQWQHPRQPGHEAAEAEEGEEDDDDEGLLVTDTDLPPIAADVDELHEQQRRQQQQHDSGSMSTAAAGAAPSRGAGNTPTGAASPAAPASVKHSSRPSKKRKGDLPPWGTDGVAAGVAALRDSHAQVRSLALQLLALLPPANMQAIVGLLQGLISCSERHQQQHWQAALAVVQQLAQQRTAMVAKSCQNICKLLAKAARGPEPCASVDVGAALVQQHQQQGPAVAAAASLRTAAAAAAHSPVAVELLCELLLATARLKASMLPALQQQLEQQGLLQAAAIQPLLAQLHEMRKQRAVLLQQQQQP